MLRIEAETYEAIKALARSARELVRIMKDRETPSPTTMEISAKHEVVELAKTIFVEWASATADPEQYGDEARRAAEDSLKLAAIFVEESGKFIEGSK